MSTTCSKLVYSGYGYPLTELSLIEEPMPKSPKPGETLVKVLLSPINPSDITTIQGFQAPLENPHLPAVPGCEGVVEIVYSTTGHFQQGDRAVVNKMDWGMWKQFGTIDEKYLIKIPKELPLEAAATLLINPCTAYLMFNSVVPPMKPGDVLIQNGANSALGQLIVQLAKAHDVKTINVVRTRPRLEETVEMLKELGADAVITDTDLKLGIASLAPGLTRLQLELPEPKVAFDCVGGSASADLAGALAEGGTMVVYGVLSALPLQVAQADLIFRDICVRGFWLRRWMAQHTAHEFGHVMQELIGLYIDGKLKLPKIHKFPLSNWQNAIKRAMEGYTNEKVLIQFNNN